MQEKVIEIIVFILSQLRNNSGIEDIDIGKLMNEGYTDAEINTAFAWIFSKLEPGDEILKVQNSGNNSHRFFHPVESKIIDSEGRGYLIQLKELGILTDSQIEEIIDRILTAGYSKPGINEVKMIVSTQLFDQSTRSEEDQRLIFQNNDTIH